MISIAKDETKELYALIQQLTNLEQVYLDVNISI